MPRRFFFRLLAAATPAGDHVPDAELLRRFARDRDPAAFELLVRRHADAVWAGCRRVLRSEADADDAFQATFLILARKAGSVRGACAGGWLYRVAVNAALKLKASGRRQPAVADIPLEQPADAGRSLTEADELAAVIHEELARLPDRYRLPVVLCDLEGHTHAQAAGVLGWPVGSVSGRLSRAHALLRDRLARRGVTAPAVLISAAVVPPSVVRDTAAAAAGAVPVPPSVLILAQGVLSAMRTAKLKLAAAVLASAGLLGLAGAGTFTALGQNPGNAPAAKTEPTPPPPNPGKAAPPAVTAVGDTITAFPDLDAKNLQNLMATCPHLFAKEDTPILPTDDALRQLQKARLNAITGELQQVVVRLQNGVAVSTESIPEITGRAVAAAADLYTDPKDLRPWLEERVRVTRWNEKLFERNTKVGQGRQSDALAARAARLEAEIALWKATHPKPAGW